MLNFSVASFYGLYIFPAIVNTVMAYKQGGIIYSSLSSLNWVVTGCTIDATPEFIIIC